MEFVSIRANGGETSFVDYGGHGTRSISSIQVLMEAMYFYGLRNKQFHIGIRTGDRGHDSPHGHPPIETNRTFAYSTNTADYSLVCPDFLWGGEQWQKVRDFDRVTHDIRLAGDSGPGKINKIGWVGSVGGIHQRTLLRLYGQQNPDIIDAREVGWTGWNDAYQGWRGQEYLTYPEYAAEWEYVIDVSGIGYSSRGKMLMHMGRVVFWAEREYNEWFFEKMVPWVHYVPVRSDLSDLIDNFHKINENPSLKKGIRENARQFALEHLQYKNALERWRDLLNHV